ncbi:MAG: hypothetical protein AB1491_07745 [Thermodesulfobacteriota bacterium]
MKPDKPGKTSRSLGDHGIIFISNTGRRFLILGRYSMLCWHQQRLRRACRRLGTQVLAALEAGEVNPLLTEAVKDTLEAARGIKEKKDQHYQAIAALRQKMRAARAGESPPPPEEPGSSQDTGGQPGNKTE